MTVKNEALIEGTRSRRLETFDINGNKLSISDFNSDDSRGVKLVYTNIPERRVIQRTDSDADVTAGSKHTFGYDEKGNVTESIFNNPRGKRSARIVDEYDYRSRMVKQTSYDANDGLSRTDEFKYKLDEKGSVIEKLAYLNSQYVSKTVYAYDGQGNVTERFEVTPSGSPFQIRFSHGDRLLLSKESYTYEFDSHGNWTRQTTSVWDVSANKFIADEVVYRTITFY